MGEPTREMRREAVIHVKAMKLGVWSLPQESLLTGLELRGSLMKQIIKKCISTLGTASDL